MSDALNFQKILQRMLTEESIKSKINLYDAFKVHFIEQKSELMSILYKRSKVFENDFYTYIQSETPVLDSGLNKEGINGKSGESNKKKKCDVIQMKLSDIVGSSNDESTKESADKELDKKPHLVKYLHQFLGEKERLYGYANARLDILVNRWTFQWTLFVFYKEKTPNADDISSIMHSFRELNENEDPLSLDNFVKSLKGETTKTKISGIKSEFSHNGWNINYFEEIKLDPLWDFSQGNIKQAPKIQFKRPGLFKSSLFDTKKDLTKHNEPKPQKSIPNIFLFDIRRLFENQQMIQRIEALMKLYIETVSNVNIDDEGWNLILAFNSRAQLVGFLSYFKFRTNVSNMKIRISQVFVLPDAQRKGIASKMLTGLYSKYWNMMIQKIPQNPNLLENLITTDFKFEHQPKIGVEGIGIESPSNVFIIVMIRFLLKNIPRTIFNQVEEEVKSFLNEQGKEINFL
jgi:GNAT superfamily N-acetyltransferase